MGRTDGVRTADGRSADGRNERTDAERTNGRRTNERTDGVSANGREGPPPDAQPRPRDGGGSQRAPGEMHLARIHLKWHCRSPHRRRSVASLALDARRFIAYSAKPS